MKKTLLFVSALFAFMLCDAQVKTHSNYDVDGDGSVTVADVTKTVNRVTEKLSDDRTVVDGESLNATLQEILLQLKSLKEQIAELKNKSCSCSCNGSGTEDPNEGDVIDPYNGHEYVDLGLSVKWATMNVGARTPSDYGDFFAWGETSASGKAPNAYPFDFTGPKNERYTNMVTKYMYDWRTYRYCLYPSDYDTEIFTKYCTNSIYGEVDGKIVLDLEDDAANFNWEGKWRTPTKAEIYELINECYWQYVTSYNDKNVCGYIVYKAKSPYDKGKKSFNNPTLVESYSIEDTHIFMPTDPNKTGYEAPGTVTRNGPWGFYMSSSLEVDNNNLAHLLRFNYESVCNSPFIRYCGFTVRPVCP